MIYAAQVNMPRYMNSFNAHRSVNHALIPVKLVKDLLFAHNVNRDII